MAKKAVFVPPPQDLRRKAVNFKKGFALKLAPEELRRLEAVVEKATDDFTREVADKLRQLRTAIAAAAEGSGDAAAAIQSIRALSLDIKGMGGMFKYPLLTAYAKSLNDFVVMMRTPNPVQLDIIAAQIDALYVVMANRITGVGGRIERDLLEALNIATEKYGPEY
ncbi:transcriptional regulator [Ferrovibrio xuzhouensis]|uniref:Transcriptional regulator n=1 Tax=Ferrovibrio xuzhouensis TaxID=1576914 RepID=A0ABV7VFF2_9PROT